MAFRSPTCAGRSTGKPLIAYRDEEEAEREARRLALIFKKGQSSYQCSICQMWHLRAEPPPREAWPECDRCRGHDGQYKVAYPSYEDAERQAERIGERERLHLRVYECPHGWTWHLTSR